MESGDAAQAGEALRDLEVSARAGALLPPPSCQGMWESFVRLLHRRGYFVATAEELAASLAEIRQIGEGYDLFDLVESLARLDVTLTECLARRPQRLFPPLVSFAPRCGCPDHAPDQRSPGPSTPRGTP